MRRHAIILVSTLVGGMGAVTDVHAQSRTLPRGSSLAATPPIDRRGKQFRALPHAYQRSYLRQGYKPHLHPY